MTIAAAGGLGVFVVLLVVVLASNKGPTVFDGSITPDIHRWARADTATWSWWSTATHLGEAIACTTGYVVLVVIALARQRLVVAVWAVVCGVTYPLVNSLTKIAVARPRPSVANPAATYEANSYPSGHTGSAATLAIVACCVIAMSLNGLARYVVAIVLLAIPVLVGLSRLALGVHYPTDVVGAMGLSLAWTTLLALAVGQVARRRSSRLGHEERRSDVQVADEATSAG